MPTNITDVATFTDPCVAPADSEAATGASLVALAQPLANRTRILKNRMDAKDAWAYFDVSGTAVASGTKFAIAEITDPTSGFSVSSNEITVPGAGSYMVLHEALLESDSATNPSVPGAGAYKTGDVYAGLARFYRFSTDTSVQGSATSVSVVSIADPATTKIYVKSTHSNTTLLGSLYIIRLT